MAKHYPIVHRFPLAYGQKSEIDGYDFDAFVVEEDEHGDFDFRLELGNAASVYWALPAGGSGRLRLFHVSGTFAYQLDEPELEADPFVWDLPRMTFEGDGQPIKSVSIELHANPPSYSCLLILEGRAPVELRWPAET